MQDSTRENARQNMRGNAKYIIECGRVQRTADNISDNSTHGKARKKSFDKSTHKHSQYSRGGEWAPRTHSVCLTKNTQHIDSVWIFCYLSLYNLYFGFCRIHSFPFTHVLVCIIFGLCFGISSRHSVYRAVYSYTLYAIHYTIHDQLYTTHDTLYTIRCIM
jgi:hypothetical protein